MAINRTWWNNLVDDDGSGITGTIWNKAVIAGLLDAIDAMGEAGNWGPQLVAGGGGTPIYTVQQGISARTYKHVFLAGRIALSSKGSLTGLLYLGGIPFQSSNIISQGSLTVTGFSGLAINVASFGGYIDPSSNLIRLTYVPGTGATAVGYLDASNLTNAFEMYFGMSYISI
jgi:hypothetical protein